MCPSPAADSTGSGPAWLEKEQGLLCRAYLRLWQSPIRGTDQRMNQLFESILEIYRRELRDVPNIRERRKRNVHATRRSGTRSTK